MRSNEQPFASAGAGKSTFVVREALKWFPESVCDYHVHRSLRDEINVKSLKRMDVFANYMLSHGFPFLIKHGSNLTRDVYLTMMSKA